MPRKTNPLNQALIIKIMIALIIVNVTGDAVVACVVAKNEKLLDEKIYYSDPGRALN